MGIKKIAFKTADRTILVLYDLWARAADDDAMTIVQGDLFGLEGDLLLCP